MSAIDGLRRSIVGRLGACGLDDLRCLDETLTQLEYERDGSHGRRARSIVPARLLAHLRSDRFHEDSDDEIQLAYRRGWNDCSNNTERWIHQGDVKAGLRELAEVAPQVPRHWLAELEEP